MLLLLGVPLQQSSAACWSFVLRVGRFWAYEVTGPSCRHGLKRMSCSATAQAHPTNSSPVRYALPVRRVRHGSFEGHYQFWPPIMMSQHQMADPHSSTVTGRRG